MIDQRDLARITSYLSEPSSISHHRADCCNRASRWLFALDRANSFSSGSFDPPLWLRRQYGWAPHSWPIYWCQLPLVDDLDCGSLAALATELFRARGQTALPVQLALQYPQEAIAVWRNTWESSLGHAAWIGDKVCYHEACALPAQGELKIWDPTESKWLTSPAGAPQRYGQLIAMRVFGDKSAGPLTFAGRVIEPGQWTNLF